MTTRPSEALPSPGSPGDGTRPHRERPGPHPPAGDVRTEESRRVVREFADRVAAGDLSAFDELVAPDFVDHVSGPQGRDGYRSTFQHAQRDFGEFTTVERHVVADGDMVAVHTTLRGTHLRSTMPLLLGVPVTGAAVEWQMVLLFRVRNGRIAEHWACRDDLGLLRQLGAWPPGRGTTSGAPRGSAPPGPRLR